jgi:hypothetical protein
MMLNKPPPKKSVPFVSVTFLFALHGARIAHQYYPHETSFTHYRRRADG